VGVTNSAGVAWTTPAFEIQSTHDCQFWQPIVKMVAILAKMAANETF